MFPFMPKHLSVENIGAVIIMSIISIPVGDGKIIGRPMVRLNNNSVTGMHRLDNASMLIVAKLR